MVNYIICTYVNERISLFSVSLIFIIYVHYSPWLFIYNQFLTYTKLESYSLDWHLFMIKNKLYCWSYCKDKNYFYPLSCILSDLINIVFKNDIKSISLYLTNYVAMTPRHSVYIFFYLSYLYNYIRIFVFYYFTKQNIILEFTKSIPINDLALSRIELLNLLLDEIKVSVFLTLYVFLSSKEKQKLIKNILILFETCVFSWTFVHLKWFCISTIELGSLIWQTVCDVGIKDKLPRYRFSIISYHF
jgi:hypothetical protein